MFQRCSLTAKRPSARYAGRGIGIHLNWTGPGGFERFLAHIGARPTDGRWSIDRIDNDGDYEPGNVRWASQITQANNTSRNVLVTDAAGRTQTISQWAREIGKSHSWLRYRLDELGLSLDDALRLPPLRSRKPRTRGMR